MDKPVLLDTDVMVDFLRGHAAAVSFVKTHADRILLSPITVAELYAGVKDDAEQTILDELIQTVRVGTITVELARSAGLHKRDYSRSHGVGLADAFLAATAESEGADLKTLNIKHFPMLKGLKRPYEKR
jgi:hypothetical protein